VRVLREERGQVLPLALFLILCLILFAMPLLTSDLATGTVILTQRAADAAAIAGASEAILSTQSDARGTTYCTTVAVDPTAAPAAAAHAWQTYLSSDPSLTTTAFSALPNGPSLTVTVSVSMPPGGFVLFGKPALAWTVSATAQALQPAGTTAC
jgi:hypothetical protein